MLKKTLQLFKPIKTFSTADLHRSIVSSRVQRGFESRDAARCVAVLVGVLPPGMHRTREGEDKREVGGGVLGGFGGVQPD